MDSTFVAMDTVSVLFNAQTIDAGGSFWNIETLRYLVLGVIVLALIALIVWTCMKVLLQKIEYQQIEKENDAVRKHELVKMDKEFQYRKMDKEFEHRK